MKRQIGIWLNSTKAVLVNLTDGEESVKTIDSEIESRNRFPGEGKSYSRLGSMQVNPSKRLTNRKKHQLHHYFDEIIDNIGDASNVFIFGPSKTKNLFEKELKKHHLFSHKPIETESSDRLTQKQLVAKVKDHFENIKS